MSLPCLSKADKLALQVWQDVEKQVIKLRKAPQEQDSRKKNSDTYVQVNIPPEVSAF